MSMNIAKPPINKMYNRRIRAPEVKRQILSQR